MKMTHPQSAQTIDVPDSAADRYRSQGWRPATRQAPGGNASLEAWQDFARTQGFTEDQLDGMGRDDLRSALS